MSDYRNEIGFYKGSDSEKVIDWTWYYPHQFKHPFAAYLIPPDLKKGEKVYLEDLIEDYIGIEWNQGNAYRLPGCEAIWNGVDFEILYDLSRDRHTVFG